MTTPLVSVRQAAEQTGLSEEHIRYLIGKGALRVMRVGYHILIPRRELRKLAADGSRS